MINFLEVDYCESLTPVLSIMRAFVNLLRFGIPILLIIFGMIDLGKAVIAGKEDEMKKAQSTLIKRFIYAVAVFLVVNLVLLVMDIVNDGTKNTDNPSSNDWYSCWAQDR